MKQVIKLRGSLQSLQSEFEQDKRQKKPKVSLYEKPSVDILLELQKMRREGACSRAKGSEMELSVTLSEWASQEGNLDIGFPALAKILLAT